MGIEIKAYRSISRAGEKVKRENDIDPASYKHFQIFSTEDWPEIMTPFEEGHYFGHRCPVTLEMNYDSWDKFLDYIGKIVDPEMKIRYFNPIEKDIDSAVIAYPAVNALIAAFSNEIMSAGKFNVKKTKENKHFRMFLELLTWAKEDGCIVID